MVDRMSTIISVQGLNLWYSANQALYDVSMELPEHEITAFIGPSGCGKTTVLSLAAGLLKPSAGEVLVYGKPPARGAAYLGYMLQKDELFSWRTVEGNIFLPLEIKKLKTPENRERALSLAEK